MEGRGSRGKGWRKGSGGKGGWVDGRGCGDKGVGWSMQTAYRSVELYNMSNRGRRVLQLFVLFGQPAAVAVRPVAAAHCLQCMRSSYLVVSVDMTSR